MQTIPCCTEKRFDCARVYFILLVPITGHSSCHGLAVSVPKVQLAIRKLPRSNEIETYRTTATAAASMKAGQQMAREGQTGQQSQQTLPSRLPLRFKRSSGGQAGTIGSSTNTSRGANPKPNLQPAKPSAHVNITLLVDGHVYCAQP